MGVFHTVFPKSSDQLRKKLGDAGEYAVVSALKKQGLKVEHVALISDTYGYDIRYLDNGTLKKIEVKSCVPASGDYFFLSRNEYDVACSEPNAWRIVQVTFSSSILISQLVKKEDIIEFRELEAASLIQLAPEPSEEFRWIESARFTPPPSKWLPSNLEVGERFSFDLRP